MKEKKKIYQDGLAKFNQVKPLTNVGFSAIFILLALVAVIPVIFVLIISISSEASIAHNGYSFFPSELSGAAYEELWKSRDYIGRAFINSIGITIVGTCLGLVLMGTLGYAMSRPTFYFKGLYTWMVFIPMLFSGGLVASYMINSQVYGFRNTYYPLVLLGCCSSWWTIIMRTFFQTTIPDSIIESGKIDGASQLRIFVQLVIPISLPVIATIGLFLTFSFWNAWSNAQLYLTDKSLFPLQYVLVRIQRNVDFLEQRASEGSALDVAGFEAPTQSVRMAIVMVIVLPIACAYPFFQRYFVSGLTIGSVKG